MTTLANTLFQLITTENLDEKIQIGLNLILKNPESISPKFEIESYKTSPARPNSFQIVASRKVPKRNFNDLQSRINFIHAIANIELLAIELPALALLRFGSSDIDFIATQMQIISEEAKHFQMLKNRLQEMQCEFGSIPVHQSLWSHAWNCETLTQHQILIPCYLEARGLDVTPDFVTQFQKLGDTETARVMQIIVDEEIEHVKHGMNYLQKIAKEQNTNSDQIFKTTLTHFFGDKTKSKIPLKREFRKRAGFSDAQMNFLEDSK